MRTFVFSSTEHFKAALKEANRKVPCTEKWAGTEPCYIMVQTTRVFMTMDTRVAQRLQADCASYVV